MTHTEKGGSRGYGIGVSAVLIAFNEEKRLGPCLETLAWADEIVIVDSESTDRTRDIARGYTENVFTVPWRGFGPQKKAAVSFASNRWIFNVDCDERVSPELSQEVVNIVKRDDALAGYTVPRKTFIGEKWIRHCGWYPDRTVRLFDRTRAGFSDDLVHERVIVDGAVGKLEGHLLHYSFRNVADLTSKLDRYGDLSARNMLAQGRVFRRTDLLFRPAFSFLRTYVLRGGFLDGQEGLAIALSTAAVVRTKYAKLKELEAKQADAGG